MQLSKQLLLFFTMISLGLQAQSIGVKTGTPLATLDVNGSVAMREGTPLSIVNGTNNDVAVDSMSFYRIVAPTAVFNITGFTSGFDGRLLTLINATSYTMTLKHQNAGSIAANRINTGGTDITVAANGVINLYYNAALTNWIVTSSQGTPPNFTTINVGNNTDSIITINNGVPGRVPPQPFIETYAWGLDGNTGTTAGTHYVGTTDAQDLVVKTNGVERMRATTSGHVGINNSTPGYRLHVEDPAGSDADILARNYKNGATYGNPGLLLQSSNGTKAAPTALGPFNPMGVVRFGGYDGSTFNDAQGAEMGGYTTQTWTSTAHGSSIWFRTIPNDAIASKSRMLIDQNGYVGIGYDAFYPQYKLDIDGLTSNSGNPLRLLGLNAGATSDSILSSASGVVRRLSINQILANAWNITGNSGTVDGTNFIGTTDNIPLSIKVNNQKAGRIDHLLNNVTLGYQAGNVNTGTQNTFMGHQAGYSNTTGYFNTFLGNGAGYTNTTGYQNTFVGDSSGYANTSGYINTGIGFQTLSANTTGYRNSAIGFQALKANTSGFANNGIGYKTLTANTTGGDNTAVGNASLFSNTTGNNNVALGNYSLLTNSTASDNTALGYSVLYFNTTGSQNTAGGYQAMLNNTTGLSNAAWGDAALYNNNGNYNTAIGSHALNANTSGVNNTALGFNAGILNTTGSNNTLIGYNANVSTAALTNASAIGYSATVGASNSLILGGTGANAVSVGIGLTAPLSRLHIEDAAGNDHMRISYDASNYVKMKMSSSGVLRWTHTGTSAAGARTEFVGNFGVAGFVAIGDGIPTIPGTSVKLSLSSTSNGSVAGFSSFYNNLTSTPTVAASNANGTSNYLTLAGSVNNWIYRGSVTTVNHTSTGVTDEFTAHEFSNILSSAGTITDAYGIRGAMQNSSTGTITNAYGFYSRPTQLSTGTMTNTYGFFAQTPQNIGAGNYTNVYGMYINNQNIGTNAYGLYIAGATTRALHINSGTSYLGGHTILGNTGTATELRFNEPSGSGTNYTAFKAQAQAADLTYTLPAADGSSGQVLSTNGTGTLSWATAGSGSNWSLTGNTGTTAGTNFVGTTDAKDLVFKTNATEWVRILTTGNVGLGLTSPSVKLHQDNGTATATYHKFTANATTGQTSTDGFDVGIDASANAVLNQKEALPMIFSTNNTEWMRLLSSGNVGIGTTTAGQKLEVSNGNLLLSNTGTAGELRIAEPSASGTNYTAFKAQAQAANLTYTLPAADGSSGQMLSTNGTGTLSWATAAGGSNWALTGNSGTTAGTNFVGTTDGQALVLKTNATEWMRILTTGNTGLGLTAPVVKLHQDNGNATATYHKFTAGTTTGQTANDGFDIGIDGTGNVVLDQNENLPMLFNTNATERMRITADGKIGIGTTNPTDRIEIISESADDNFDDGSIITYAASASPSFALKRAKGTAASPSTVGNSEYSGGFNTFVHNGTSFVSATGINVITASDFTTSGGSELNFSTGRNGTITDRMRITSTGNVGIGVAAPSHILQINGQGRATNSAWATTSDIRLKNIDGAFDYGLKELLRINTYRFHYKKDNPLNLPTDKSFQGTIAQELQKIMPEAVQMNPDGYLTVNSDPVFWTMLNSIKELNSANEKVKAENDALKAELNILKTALNKQSSLTESLISRLEKLEASLNNKPLQEPAVKTDRK